MGPRYLIDTCTAIYFLDGKLPERAAKGLKNILSDECNLSVISKIEMLSWKKLSREQEDAARGFLGDSNICPLTDEVVEKTIEIRKTAIRKIKISDAIIAATALIKGYSIITRNIDDFTGIIGIRVLDPFGLV